MMGIVGIVASCSKQSVFYEKTEKNVAFLKEKPEKNVKFLNDKNKNLNFVFSTKAPFFRHKNSVF